MYFRKAVLENCRSFYKASTMSEIKFSNAEKQALVHKVKNYFMAKLHQEIGQFDAEFFLDFFSK